MRKSRCMCISPEHSRRWWARLVAALLASSFLAGAACAGGGPANVAVVVNADSWASMTVANEFVHLRRVPASNVIYLSDLPGFEQTTVDLFRERILEPSLRTIRDRGLAEQIDYLVYSSDLPSRINVKTDKEGEQFSKVITPHASINGLTYLHRYVLDKDTTYLRLNVNRYARLPEPLLTAEPLPEDQRRAYVSAIKLMEEEKWADAVGPMREIAREAPRVPALLYNLACALARAGEADEAIAYLQRAVEAGFLNFAHLAADKDLKSLREREDFQQLVERMKTREFDVQPTRGFRSGYAWDEDGEVAAGGGRSYLLSTTLGVTSGRGNSVREVLECLRRSAAADGTKPAGTIYYMVNSNIRSLTRQWGFGPAAAKLAELGVSAELADGKLPQEKAEVQGLMAGSATFDWAASKSTILPGAICEHLTSAGGVMFEGASQTPLTEFIRHGATASAGTVTEPYAIQAKFPDPFIHVHYARGCTLAEAFYQSVRGPYQLLIVGDPLCRPWAEIPVVTAEGVKAGETISGQVSLRPAVQGDAEIGRCELLVDGRRHATCTPAAAFDLDTTELCDGYHELRVVAVSADVIETQGELILPVQVSNHGRRLTVTSPADKNIAWGKPLKLRAKLSAAGTVCFMQNERVLATSEGAAEAEVVIDSRLLGLGPVRIQGVEYVAGGETARVTAEPIEFEVVPPPALPALEVEPDANWAKGIEVTPDGGQPLVVESTKKADWLAEAGVKDGQGFSLVGYFDVRVDDVYQLQVRAYGELVLEVDSTVVAELAGDEGWQLLPVALAAGTHKLTVRGVAAGKPRLNLRFGGAGALSVGAERFRCAAPG